MSHTLEAASRRSANVPTPTAKGSARFTKADRLRRRAEFLRAQAQGKRLHTRHFGLTLAPGAEGGPRLGLVVTRRLGKAVRRNRVKRVLREFFRLHKHLLPVKDIIIMAKKGADALSYQEVHAEIAKLLLTRAQETPHD